MVNEVYINVSKFVKDIKDNIGKPEMDEAFDNLYTEFENALYDAMDMDQIERYKDLYVYALNKVIEEVKKFKKQDRKPIITKSIINLDEAMEDTIRDLKEDADLFKKMD